jgi:hypothetical protein
MSYESDDSFNTLQDNLETMTDVINACNKEIAALERNLEELQRPIESLEVSQLGDVPFLSTSPFRQQTFRLYAEAVDAFRPFAKGVPIDAETRLPFETICAMIRTHFFETGAVAKDGTITLTEEQRELFGIQEPTTTFLILLKHIRNVLV